MKTKYEKFLKFLRHKYKSDIKEGDYVEPINFEGLTPNQVYFLKSKKQFYVDEVIEKKDQDYIEVGYTIPLKISRFKKVIDTSAHKILFLQFDLKIDTHGEPDTLNFFRGVDKMGELYPILINEKFFIKTIRFQKFLLYTNIKLY